MLDLIIGCIPLLIALIVSLIIYNRPEQQWFRLFPLFLLSTFIFQTGGYLYSLITRQSNHFIFNCYLLVEYLFYLTLFYNCVNRKLFKKIIGLLGLSFLLLYFYHIVILNQFFFYDTISKNYGQLLTLICCCLYLAELLMTDELLNYFKIPMFWITTGIMVASVGHFMYISFFNYILSHHLDPDGYLFGVISTTLSVIEYGFFTIGFLCKKRCLENS